MGRTQHLTASDRARNELNRRRTRDRCRVDTRSPVDDNDYQIHSVSARSRGNLEPVTVVGWASVHQDGALTGSRNSTWSKRHGVGQCKRTEAPTSMTP